MKKNRKVFALVATLALAAVLAGCAGSGIGQSTSNTESASSTIDTPGGNTQLASIDYGTSSIYTREELEEAAIQVKCNFAAWDGCELHSLRYAGDECNSQENIDWLNEINEGASYTQIVEFIGDYHSPVTLDTPSAWEPDTEYTDYQWWLARSADSGWELVSSGY